MTNDALKPLYIVIVDDVPYVFSNSRDAEKFSFNYKQPQKILMAHDKTRAALAPVDVEGLKKDTSNMQELLAKCEDFTVGYNSGWNAAIDHLAAQGMIKGVEYDDEQHEFDTEKALNKIERL